MTGASAVAAILSARLVPGAFSTRFGLAYALHFGMFRHHARATI